jgi:hypothetical protein
MNFYWKALLVLSISVTSIFAQAQCPGCIIQDSLCPASASGTDVVICGNATFTDTAGTAFEGNVTFLFNTGFRINQGDDLFAALGVPLPIPIPGGFPAPFDITVYVERGTLNSISGLPAGISWETDSSTNGNNYSPALDNKGCVKFCGTLACGQSGTFTAVMNFTTLSRQNLSGLPTLPIPGFALPDSSLNNYDLPVTFTIDPSTNLILSVSTAGPSTVIDSGEIITLNATPGFDSYSWSSGETSETVNLAPTDTTVYTVTATDLVGCTQTDSIEVQVLAAVDSLPNDTTGIISITNNNHLLSIYPNPSKGSFMVNIASPISDGAIIEVLDITGKRVYNQALYSLNNTITLDAAKGLYLVKVITGNSIFTQKLLIH